MEKNLEYYLNLPYTIEMHNTPGEGWFIKVKELPGCMSQGDTPEKAVQMIQDAMRTWIQYSVEDGDPIPEPKTEEQYSGKFVVRVPRSLHRELVETAEREGVSLNALISAALAKTVGEKSVIAVNASKPGLPPKLTRVGLDENAGQAVPYSPASQTAHRMAERKAKTSRRTKHG